MSERLTCRMKVIDAQYAKGSPLLLMACALYMDAVTNQCVAQLKWRNLDSRPVKAILIELDGYDGFNQRLEPVSFQYADITVAQGKDFGSRVPVPIRDASMARYEVLLKAVSFATGDVWQADPAVPFSALPPGKEPALTGELYAQYRRELFKQGIFGATQFQPQTAMGLWQCGCGSWQAEGTPCLSCKATMSGLQEYANPEQLEEHLKQYKLEQEEAVERALIACERERAARKLREEEERQRQKQRQKKISALKEKDAEEARAKKIMAIILAVTILAAVLIVPLI